MIYNLPCTHVVVLSFSRNGRVPQRLCLCLPPDELLGLLHSLVFPLELFSEDSFCLLETFARSMLSLLFHVECIPNTLDCSVA